MIASPADALSAIFNRTKALTGRTAARGEAVTQLAFYLFAHDPTRELSVSEAYDLAENFVDHAIDLAKNRYTHKAPKNGM